jgi:hypothetical protein
MSANKAIVRTYETILDEAANLIRGAEAANLSRYWELGRLVSEFLLGSDRKKYGSKTVQSFASDIQARGILTEAQDPVRLLYWAKAVHESYKLEYIEQMCQVGFTVYHAKILLSLSPEERDQIQPRLLDKDGQVVSGRQLIQLVREEKRAETLAKIDQVREESRPEAVTAPEVRTVAADGTTPPARTVSYSSADDPTAADEQTPAGPPRREPERSGPTPAQPRQEREMPASPLKVLASTEKVATKLLAGIPDALIVVREVGQRGFDSDRAHQNYRTKLQEARTALSDLIAPIQELVQIMDEELGA